MRAKQLAEKLFTEGKKCQGTTLVVPQNAKSIPALAAEEMQAIEMEPSGAKSPLSIQLRFGTTEVVP
jgi:hypothetical protein